MLYQTVLNAYRVVKKPVNGYSWGSIMVKTVPYCSIKTRDGKAVGNNICNSRIASYFNHEHTSVH